MSSFYDDFSSMCGSNDHNFATSKSVKITRLCLEQKSFKIYSAKIQQYEFNTSKTNVQFYMHFPENSTNVSDEVLIFDEIGLLGSVGGALGLFVGFSFFGYATSILDSFVDKVFLDIS